MYNIVSKVVPDCIEYVRLIQTKMKKYAEYS